MHEPKNFAEKKVNPAAEKAAESDFTHQFESRGSGGDGMPSAPPPPVQLQAANPASCTPDAVNDWTPEELANLDMGTDLVGDMANRITPECLADTQTYADELLEQYDCHTSNGGRNGGERRTCGHLSYGDYPDMIDQFTGDLPTEVQRVAAWNQIAQGSLERGVDNRDLNPNLMDPALPASSVKHVITPFTDNYHGRLGGIDGDAPEPFSAQPVPTFLDGNEMDWYQGLPAADSAVTGEDQLSHAYAEILRRESIPEGANLDTWLRRVGGGSRGDAEASMSTIENFRAYRAGGWEGFSESFQDRVVRPPFVREPGQRGPGYQPRTMPGIGGVLDQLFQFGDVSNGE